MKALLQINTLALLVAAAISLNASAEDAAYTTAKVGPPLPEAVVDLFVPPTRSAEPYAATAHDVYVLDADSKWKRVFHLAADKGAIAKIAGYAKASQPLYVAYSTGVAATHDAGSTWSESTPAGHGPEAGTVISLSVSPSDRKTAILATARQIWSTADFGETWQTVATPANIGAISAAGFDQGPDSGRVLVAADTLYSTALGENWSRLELAGDRPALLAASTGYFDVVTGNGHAWRIDLTRSGVADLKLSAPANTAALASDPASQSDLWLVTPAGIEHLSLPSGERALAARTSLKATGLSVHPRKAGAAFYSEGTQVWRVEPAAPAASPAPLKLAWNPLTQTPVELNVESAAAAPESGSVVEELLRTQPPLQAVLAAATDHLEFGERDIREWKRKVRTRNALPNFRVLAGDKQALSTEYTTVFPGTTQVNDIHLSDDKTRLDSYTFEVEWKLGDLLFDDHETDISRESRYLYAQRNDVIRQVTDLYYERIQALAKLRDHAHASSQERLVLELQARKTTDLLNEICGQKLLDPGIPAK